MPRHLTTYWFTKRSGAHRSRHGTGRGGARKARVQAPVATPIGAQVEKRYVPLLQPAYVDPGRNGPHPAAGRKRGGRGGRGAARRQVRSGTDS